MKGALRIRIMSANLKNGGAEPDALGALVEAVDPDVLAVQELAPEQSEVLARLLPFGKLEPARDHKGMGIALRRPGSIRYVPLRYRGLYVAEVDPGAPGDDGEPVEVVNAHLAAPHTLPIRRALAHRREQLRGLVGYLDGRPGAHRALVGDLNSTPLWPAYRRLVRRFADAAVEAARRGGGRPAATWGPRPGGPRVLRIDHVLVHGLVAETARVFPIRGSDHGALVVDLTVRTGGGGESP